MNTNITNEIVKFIVHNLISQSYPGNLNNSDDSDEEYNRGWNEALKNYQDNLLQQIKNISPELTDTIVNMIVDNIDKMLDGLHVENCDEDKSFAFQKKGTAGQVGYEIGIQDMKVKIGELLKD